MRVLIVGAGPAGLTLALCLARSGVRADIIERAPRLNTGGYVVSLQANGWDVADRLGLLADVRACALPAADSVYRDGATGRELFRYKAQVVAELTGGKMLHVPRDVLVARLAEALAATGHPGPRFGCTVTALAQAGEGAQVCLGDGTSAAYDLVVGADGMHSQVRALAFGPEAQFCRPLGYRGAAWRMPFDGRLDPPYEGYMEVGRQVILYQSGPRELSTLLCWRCDDLAPVPARDRHRVVLDAYAGTWPVLRQIIDGAVDWEAAYLDALGQIEMPRWWDGRTVLLGDAAWGLSFLSGQGASMAMAGAYLLAQALRTAGMGGGSAIPSGALAQALAAWEAGLRPTLTRVQHQARAMARSYVPRSSAGLWLNRRLLPLLMSRPLLKLRARHLVAPSLIAPADLDGGRPPVPHSGRG
ncbi:FAD-dependent monooxygenase [Aquabacter sp. P-9]|uniref:FAD-dependent monooxygenase n=1 Tax=Aquabacter sediminis TaxID=3029197 RepID=UPI00237DDB3D|nr:FAD-dependent monooxygenase [Aquabacter sp. P-9]MDE1569129.1 FAD-dependent monooxygenase [Aquabacter sp. P-9]